MRTRMLRFLATITVATLVLSASADANAPAGRYVVTNGGTGHGTVFDTKTKLTWQQTPSSSNYYGIDEAFASCSSSAMSANLGGTGWRLPTIKELLTIVDDSQFNGAIDRTAFSLPAGPYWSSSRLTGNFAHTTYFVVDFSTGGTLTGAMSQSANNFRCVR